jgi:hypothetical protein
VGDSELFRLINDRNFRLIAARVKMAFDLALLRIDDDADVIDPGLGQFEDAAVQNRPGWPPEAALSE